MTYYVYIYIYVYVYIMTMKAFSWNSCTEFLRINGSYEDDVCMNVCMHAYGCICTYAHTYKYA